MTLEKIKSAIEQIKSSQYGYGPREIRLNAKMAEKLTKEEGDLAAILGIKIIIVDIKSVVLVDIAGLPHQVN